MMSNKKLRFAITPLASAVAASLFSLSASAVDFHGYGRSGIGMSDDGDLQCMSVQLVGRLGNECSTYFEVDLQQELYNKDGKEFRVEVMWATETNQDNDWEPIGDGGGGLLDFDGDGSTDADTESSDGTFALRQFNITAKGVLGFAPEATLWAGKRFYQRHDIHHIDYYYWDISGPGAGVENIEMGAGKLSLAWTRSDRKGDNGEFDYRDSEDPTYDEGLDDINGNIFDIRYAGIPIGSSNLEVGAMYYMPNPTDAQDKLLANDDGGVILTAELTSSLMGGFNKFVFQYGTEGYAHALRYAGAGSWYSLENTGQDGEAFRIMDHGVVNLSSSLEVGYAAYYISYDRDDFGDAHTIMHVSARPVFKWDDINSTILEVGYFDADDDAWGEDDGFKVTLAQAWAAGSSYWARPVIRVFASHISTDSDSFRGGEDSVVNFGVQAEAWW